MKIIITGSEGILGSELTDALSGEFNLIPLSHSDLDITNPEKVESTLAQHSPDALINTAANVDVDGCESDVNQAMLVNGHALHHVAKSCSKHGVKLVHISTDYVFDGRASTPYSCGATPNPINVYGISKLAGEQFVKHYADDHLIIRTSSLYGGQGDDHSHFVNLIKRLAREEKKFEMVDDQVSSPTWARELSLEIGELIKSDVQGLYHRVSTDSVNWFEFARMIVSQLDETAEVVPVSSEQSNRPATRPAYTALQNGPEDGPEIRHLSSCRDAVVKFLSQ